MAVRTLRTFHRLDDVRRLLAGVVIAAATLGAMAEAADTMQIGQPAPAFVLDDLAGAKVPLDAYRGQPVVVHFWATWCGACLREMPELEGASRADTDPVAVVAISVGEDPATVARHVAANRYAMRIALDRDWRTAERYGVVALPATFFIDGNGILRERVDGGNLTSSQIVESVRRLVRAAQPRGMLSEVP